MHSQQGIAQQKLKLWYDKKARSIQYKPGQQVLVLQPQPGKPLALKYSGPFNVVKQTSAVDYVIDFQSSRKPYRVIHANLIRPYHKRTEFVADNVSEVVAAVIQLVEVNHVSDGGQRRYGYSQSFRYA